MWSHHAACKGIAPHAKVRSKFWPNVGCPLTEMHLSGLRNTRCTFTPFLESTNRCLSFLGMQQENADGCCCCHVAINWDSCAASLPLQAYAARILQESQLPTITRNLMILPTTQSSTSKATTKLTLAVMKTPSVGERRSKSENLCGLQIHQGISSGGWSIGEARIGRGGIGTCPVPLCKTLR